MKVYALSVYFCTTRETITVGIYSTEEEANNKLREFRTSRVNDKEKYPWEDWFLKKFVLDNAVTNLN